MGHHGYLGSVMGIMGLIGNGHGLSWVLLDSVLDHGFSWVVSWIMGSHGIGSGIKDFLGSQGCL
jgi:hypothetical protein